MLGGTETVTVIHCDGEMYTAASYSGASWFDKTQIRTEDKGLVFSNAVKVRIPAQSIGAAALPQVGDHILRGAPSDAICTPADLAKHGARKVMAVGDNRRGRLRHVVVIGQ